MSIKHRFSRIIPGLFLAILLFYNDSSWAESALAPVLSLPVACQPGVDCWVVNYVDSDPAPKTAKDFTCGHQTYDEHEGTDIGIRDTQTMMLGVNVVAAAGGTVGRARDENEDAMPAQDDIEKMKAEKKGCGNGVLIDHGEGWQTIYCHMKKDSIKFKPGQIVKPGDVLGQVGHSGIAEFPHLHFGVFRDGKTIDPFSGRTAQEGCGLVPMPLWDIQYEPFSLYAGGFSGAAPDFEIIRLHAAGLKEATRKELPSLVFWAGIYGAAKDDRISVSITGPDGKIFAQRDVVQEKSRARQFYYVGKKNAAPLSPGIYTGTITLTRGNKTEKFSETIKVTE